MSIIKPTRQGSWDGCHQPAPHERMAHYSARHADDMRRYANACAAPPRVRLVDDRHVLVSFALVGPSIPDGPDTRANRVPPLDE